LVAVAADAAIARLRQAPNPPSLALATPPHRPIRIGGWQPVQKGGGPPTLTTAAAARGRLWAAAD